jgi:NADH dehydrogenase
MILITGSTGFIGNILIRHLVDLGHQVKLLLRPGKTSPNIPKGLTLDVAIASLNDEKSLQSALKNVDVIYHLASAESFGRLADLDRVDIQGTQSLLNAASQAEINRFVFVSHLGADRASAYPLLKAKGIAEHFIMDSGLSYTIFRSAVVFGNHDHFTNDLALLLKLSPYFVMAPDEGTTILQPIWVEDLVTVMTWALDMPETKNRIIEVGGPEFLTFKEICQILMKKINIKRQLVNVSPVFLNFFTELIEILLPNFPVSVFMIDYLATHRSANLDVLPREFNLLPARFEQRLGHLEGRKWLKNLGYILFNRKRKTIRWE